MNDFVMNMKNNSFIKTVIDTAVDKRAVLLLADISTKFQGCRHKIVPQNIAPLHKKCVYLK